MAKVKSKRSKGSYGHSRPGIFAAIFAALIAAGVKHSIPNFFGGVSAKQAKAEYLEAIDTECNHVSECKSKLMVAYNRCIANLDDHSSKSAIEDGQSCFLHDSTRAAALYSCDGNALCVMTISNHFERCYQAAKSNLRGNTEKDGQRMGEEVVSCLTRAAGIRS